MSTITADPDVEGTTREEKLLDKFRRWFRFSEEATREQRRREEEDLRFQVPENQWDEAARQQRMGGPGSPARPILSVSQIDQPIRLVTSAARAAKLGVTIHPVSEDASEEAASIREGLYSRIQRDSNANQARLWAFDRAVKAGVGWYRVDVKYDEDSEEMNDLEIVIKRILHQACVFYDPSAVEPDMSDGEFLFFVQWMTLDKYREQHPESKIAKLEENGTWFEALELEAPGWVRVDGDVKSVQIAECFYKEHEYTTINEGTPRERERDTVKVQWALIDGCEVLKEQEWMGKYIPFIPVFGRELQPFNNQRRIEGMTRPARDACKFSNYALSTFLESFAREPKTPVMMAAGQDEGYEAEWQELNVKLRSVVHYNAKVDGIPETLPPPQRLPVDQGPMSLSHQAVLLGRELVQTSTATYDPSLGKANHQEESGRKVLALQSQGDAATSDFHDNLGSVSLRYEAIVVLDLMPPTYDAKGRIVTILGGEDKKPQKIMLNRPYVMDEKTGRPKAAKAGDPAAKYYNLSEGRYGVAAIVGKSNQTRLQDGAEQITKFLEADPAAMPILGPTWLGFQDFPGAKEMGELLAKYRDNQFPFLKDDEGQQGPGQIKAALVQAQQQGQMLQQQLQQAVQALQTKQVEAQATLQGKQLEVQGRIEIQRMANEQAITLQSMKDAAAIAVAQINAEVKGLQLATEARNEQIALHQTQAHEVGMAAQAQAHAQEQQQMAAAQEAASQQADQQHAAGMQEQAQGHDAAQADADRQAAAEQAAAAAQAGPTGAA